MPPRTGWNAPSQSRFRDESDDEDNFVRRPSNRDREREERRDRDRDRDRGGRDRDRDGERFEGFSSSGRALGRNRSPDPLVIAPQPNKDWREAARRVPTYKPEARDEEVVTHERTGDEPQRAGLRFIKREPGGEANGSGAGNGSSDVKTEVKAENEADVKPTEEERERKPLTLEEQALQAVLAGDTGASASTVPADFAIASAANARHFPTEEDALRRDLEDLPEESNLDDYEAVPIEAFGAAILRGMGYDPKKDTPLHVPKARPALLGLGATSLATEIPPTSKKKDSKARKEAYATRGGRGFNAAQLLVRSGTNTPRGERDDSRERSDRESSRNGTPDDRRRRREDDDDDGRDAKRRDDRDRERPRDRDRDRDRRDDRRYETEEERARRKARERERDDRDRERDSYRRDDRERERERDRDRRDDRERRSERRDDRDRDRRDDRRDDRRARDRDRDDRDRRDRDRERR